jgi:hypothetical protein
VTSDDSLKVTAVDVEGESFESVHFLGMDLNSGRVKEMDRESETPPSEKIEEMICGEEETAWL